uniref:Uncharacterized protein n=1 Tax=Rhizophora mucronata TaxID=61149 RepID=A0A2P2MSU3_RHIMU
MVNSNQNRKSLVRSNCYF